MENDERLFYCYSEVLKMALDFNEFKCVASGINDANGDKYWLYFGTEELNNYKNNIYPLEKHKFKRFLKA